MSPRQRPTSHRSPACLHTAALPWVAPAGCHPAPQVRTQCLLLSLCECADRKRTGVSKVWNTSCAIALKSSHSKTCDVPRDFRWPFCPEVFCFCKSVNNALKHLLCKQERCSCLGREQDGVLYVLPKEILRCISLAYSLC